MSRDWRRGGNMPGGYLKEKVFQAETLFNAKTLWCK